MSPAATHEPPYSKSAGEEPLPGYRLIEPLGRGGFGEVWKCMAPGDLPKAVKFVAGDNGDARLDDASLRQEFEAFQQIKMIRHPYLLTLERVELVRGELVMVMELADRQLLDRFDECRAEGLPGIPRDELLCYLAEAAEALDVIAAEHKLQHLDVKPANLFIISGHAKVGDYGLVARLEKEKGNSLHGRNTTRGLTPRYAAPEVANGQVDHRSDQYSLALVYQEMLTGVFPFKAKSPALMLLAHATTEPDLSALPDGDRGPVGRALAKDPGGRFRSCLDLIAALIGGRKSGQVPASGPIRRAGPSLSGTVAASPDHPTASNTTTMPGQARPPLPVPNRPALTLPGRPAAPPRAPSRTPDPPNLPKRHVPEPDTDDGVIEWVTPSRKSRSPALRSELIDDKMPDVEPVGQLGKFWSVLTAAELSKQKPAGKPLDAPLPQVVIDALLRAAGGETGLARRHDGSWVVRVPLRPVSGVVRLKLRVAAERWAQEMIELDESTVAVRAYAPPGGFFGGRKKSGIELIVRIPPGEGLGEAEITGRLFGNPDVRFARAAAEDLPRRIDEVRQHLQNVTDRRKHPRLPTDSPAVLFPVTSDGAVYPAVPGRCRDVSREGVRLITEASVVTTHAYVGVGGVPGADGWCLLTRLVRSRELPTGYEYGGKFRTDIK